MEQEQYDNLCSGAFLTQLLMNAGVGFYAGMANAQGQDTNTALVAGTLIGTSVGRGALYGYGVRQDLEDSIHLFDFCLSALTPHRPMYRKDEAFREGTNSLTKNLLFIGPIEMLAGYGLGYLAGKMF